MNKTQIATGYVWAYGAMATVGAAGVVNFAMAEDAIGVYVAAAVMLAGALVCQYQLHVRSLERTWDRRLNREADKKTPEYAVAQWQKTRDRIRCRVRRRIGWDHDLRGGEGLRLVNDRVREQYDAAAGDARARGEWVPTIEQLRVDAQGDNTWP